MKSKILALIGIILFIFIILRLNLGKVWIVLKSVDVFLFLISLLIAGLVIIIRALRWGYISKKINLKISYISAIYIWFKALFAENTPGKVGELLVRATFTRKKGKNTLGKSLFSVIFDRIIDALSTVLAGFLSLFVLIDKFEIKSTLIIPLVFFIISLAVIYWLRKKDRAIKLIAPFYKKLIPFSLKIKIKKLIIDFYAGVKKLDKKTIIISMLLSFFAIFVTAIGFWFLAFSLSLDISLWYLLVCVPLITLILILPVSISGLGTREAGFIILFSIIGIPAEISVAFSLLLLIQRILLAIIGLALFTSHN